MRSHILSERSDFGEGMLRKWRQDSIPSLCGMFVYDNETSSVMRIALLGSGPSCWSLSRKCVVCLM